MINLAPNDHKESLRYARRNSLLMSWLVGLIAVLISVLLIQLSGFAYLRSETKNYQNANAKLEQELKDRDLEGTLKSIDSISNNLKLIVKVLSKQVIFSELIKQIGAVMPENAVLSQIEISKVEGGLDLKANTKDQNSATQVQVNLTDPNNKLFDKVDIVSIDCNSNNPDPNYPCKATYRALFTSNNPFLFMNQQKANGASQ